MPPKLVYRRGDVILVLFPHFDLRTAKLCPVLIIRADHLQRGLPQVIAAMVTSPLFRANHPCRVTVQRSSPEGKQSGFLTESVIMSDNLATIDESEIELVIDTFSMTEIDRGLRHTRGMHPEG